ncbi:syntenin-1-like [Anopheles stephensi]|uniref:syntenin-1-like n=1 Tax=Anopheles stephensi TaxID=30069 RepID=UPI00165887B4|nr:syntenin-1-like [Anopheles stephensi]XP_035908566.1 syntenin-1-like [Anopheles stephensi]XP_035908567.1 syntenin-1-like [Anopheles stephensi]XP_035908568.1 syntenin-1-like [Anopheles stephensi]XP_035908570.1 syntenin-1-like [Anopheles stephensi]
MSLYPSLEDMMVDKMVQSQNTAIATAVAQQQQQQQYQPYPPSAPATKDAYGGLYPNFTDANRPTPPVGAAGLMYPDLYEYMGLELSKEMIHANLPQYVPQATVPSTAIVQQQSAVAIVNNANMVAPVSGHFTGLQRGQVTNGIRELIMCKGADKKVGLRVQAINKGIFVCVVVKNSPAAMAGLRFGDQILQINGTLVAGFSVDDVHKLLKKSDSNNISVVVRDRPFERAITLHKDSSGSFGFQFNNGTITAIVKDSSAARNGLIIDQQLLEVNGQNVIAMKDKEIGQLISASEQVITLTIVPKMIYDVMMKKLSTSWLRGKMDHSVPDF